MTTITIHESQYGEPQALEKALTLALRQSHSDRTESVDIYPQERKVGGWLEYTVIARYTDGGRLVMGLLQRTEGADFEVHS